jgi:hypothetical protein
MIAPSCRLVAAAVTVVAALAAGTSVALADHTQRLDISAELVRQQAGGKPWIVNLGVGAVMGTTDGTVPEPIRHMRFSFTKGAKVHPEAFATCTQQILHDKGPNGCPTTSRLGRGTAIANALGADYPATIDVFNGAATKAGRKLLFYARALSTVIIPLEGTLKKSTGKYGWVLDVPVQKIQIVGDQYASITSFAVNVGGIGRKHVPFIEAPTSCTKPGWPFLGQFTYADGATGSSSATIRCVLQATSDD